MGKGLFGIETEKGRTNQIITKERLRQLIDNNYNSKADFIRDFNGRLRSKVITSSALSNQLTGNVQMSRPFQAAYVLFFKEKSTSSNNLATEIKRIDGAVKKWAEKNEVFISLSESQALVKEIVKKLFKK